MSNFQLIFVKFPLDNTSIEICLYENFLIAVCPKLKGDNAEISEETCKSECFLHRITKELGTDLCCIGDKSDQSLQIAFNQIQQNKLDTRLQNS